MRERIFEPLGMKDTAFSVPPSKIDRLPTSYMSTPKSGALDLFDDAANGQWSRPPAFPSGAGGLVSTIDDYFAFGQSRRDSSEGQRTLSARRRSPGSFPPNARSARFPRAPGIRRFVVEPLPPTPRYTGQVRANERWGVAV
jgi:CubicO group peptidase (beta-lactamase class C family)